MLVDIEISITRGIPRNTIVGLPHGAVREALDRIRSALLASGFEFPRGAITVNLAPADVRKEGTSFDLPIALGILMAEGSIRSTLKRSATLIMGEVSLDGSIRPVRGVLAALHGAVTRGISTCIVPEGNTREATVLDGLRIFGVRSLTDAVAALNGEMLPSKKPVNYGKKCATGTRVDFSEVVGQSSALRAMEIAASGGHNLLLIGPPGCGKTMLSRRLSTILPPWSQAEALETTCIHSLRGLSPRGLIAERPFRAPHHSVSMAGLIGGGHPVLPGEVSLAHQGVLFLDELAEYSRSVLESLREPLEEKSVIISRAQGPVRYPARFQLIAAMNPCPCGYAGVADRVCICTNRQLNNYRSRVSGPLMDRIDMQVMMGSVSPSSMLDSNRPSSQDIRTRVRAAELRLRKSNYSPIREMMTSGAEETLNRAVNSFSLSMRSRKRIMGVAKTIAALSKTDQITKSDISEAVSFRHRWH